MNALQDFADTIDSAAVVRNLGWLLIHSWWQCTLVALVAQCIAKATRPQASSARYWTYSLALSLMVMAPVMTMLAFPQTDVLPAANAPRLPLARAALIGDVRQDEGDDGTSTPTVATRELERGAAAEISQARPADVPLTKPLAKSYADAIKAMLGPWLSTIVAAWSGGVLLFSLRPIGGWFMVRRLLRIGTSPVGTHVREALQRVSEKMRVRRRVEILASNLVGSPIVVGCFRSVILVPASFVSSLPLAQVEAILAHELAHVRRYDYLVNLLQTLVETLFFYHPAVWWLSSRIRIERENCCDDLVVAVLDNKAEYGRALLAVEEFRGKAASSALALSARDGSLLHRIRRLLAAPSVGDQRMSAGLAAIAIAGTGLMIAMVWWSTMASAQNDVGEAPFGEASHGLIARIVPLRPDVDDHSPNLTSVRSEFETTDEMTFGVELKNTGQKPVTLALPNQKPGLMAPIWFQLQFLDLNGKPIPRTQRELYKAWQFAANATSRKLAPGQSLTVVLRPAGYRAPLKHELPAGKYRVKVRYRGPDAAFKKSVQEHSPDSKVLQAWEHSVESNEIEFVINKSMPRLALDQLNWGKPQGGLQAAVEFRTSPAQRGNPHHEPGIPVGSSYRAVYHIKNVGDRIVRFVSETGRQDDRVIVVNEQGDGVPVKDAWISGWPIDVAWTLEPNEIAELEVLTPSISGISQPGKYNVRYIIRFNSRVQKDAEGKVVFPRQGDYDLELETGSASLFLTSAPSNAAADKPKAMESTRAGRWQITNDAELEITQRTFHATDIITSGVIRLQGDKDHPRHIPLSIAMDHFANRERWKAAWEAGKPVLWYAKGQGDGPGRIMPSGTKVKIEELRRIDFSNPDCIVHHAFSGWVADQLPSVEIRAALEQVFTIKEDGQEHHRYYESARHGLQPDDASRHLFVWVGENGNCQVQDLAWAPNTGESGEVKCNLKTLSETLALVLKKYRAQASPAVPIYAFVTSRPNLPAEDLKTVLDACRQHGLKTPEFPSAGPPKREVHGLNRLRKAWREFYAEQPAGDSTFARNAFVDLTGKSPSSEVLLQFVNESAPDKRFRLIDRLLAHEDFERFQGRLTDENDAFQTQQTSLPPRILRGPPAKSRADVYRTKAGKPVKGLTLAVALRSATNRFRIGERIPLDVLVLNTSKEAITHDFSFDFIANPPRVLDEAGNHISMETLLLTGAVPLYRETLRPGDAFVYPHIGLGLGENPKPGENWHPHTPVLRPGKYRLTQQWNDWTSGEIEFEVVSGDPENTRATPKNNPAWLRFCPGTRIVAHTDAQFVSGMVVDEEGRPIPGCRVEHPELVGPKTDDQGKFQYKQSTPHRTVLRAYHPDYHQWHGAPELGDVVRIVLHKKRKVEAVNGTREMTVRVIDSRTAEPVPNVKVTASRYEGPRNGTVAATAVTNQDGAVVMRGLDFIQHQLSLNADQPIRYIGNRAHPGAGQDEVVMLVDRACELVLRAVDSETGKGIAGARFDRERALAELWAEPVVNDILGSKQAAGTSTDANGYARFLVGPATWSYMILKFPEGYDSIVPIAGRQEVEIETPAGGNVEYTFRLVKKM